MGNKKYFTEEERKAAKREENRRYYQANKEKVAKRQAEYGAKYRKNNKEKRAACWAEWYQNNKEKVAAYYQRNKEKIAENGAAYRKTPKGRAAMLVNNYKKEDKKQKRGECTLTADWIVQNIFSQPCHYCGETDWKELGCDRIDNSLPHVPDNVVPCCWECNTKKGTTPYDEYMKMIGELTWGRKKEVMVDGKGKISPTMDTSQSA